MKPLRILILSDPYGKPSFAPRLRYLCDYLSRRGHRVDVYTEQWDEIPFPHAYPIHEIRLMKGGLWAMKAAMNLILNWKSRVFTRRVRKLTRNESYDLVFCTTFSTFPLQAALSIAREKNLPLVTDIRDLDEQVPGAQYQYHRGAWTRPWRQLYSRIEIRRRNRVIHEATAVTTISPWHVDFLKRINPNTRLIYNGYDPNQFYPEDIKTSEFRVSYIGRLYEFQSLSLIKECVSELNLPHLRLNIHTPDHEPLPIDAIGDEIRRSSVMIVLTNTEAKGMMTTKFFEALGCEKPVLCIPNDQGALADAIRKTKAGLASENKEEIKAFLLDKYREWQANGFTRQAVDEQEKQRFSREYQAKLFEQLFEELQSPVVSVIIPLYNAAEYLPECLESVIRQDTDARLEILIVNDGSTDDSLRITKEWVLHYANDPHRSVTVIDIPHAGQSAARNKGLEQAAGAYVTFVDADDRLDKDYIRTLLAHAGTYPIVQCGYRRFTNDGTILEEKRPKHFYRFTSPCMRLYRREVLQGLRFPEGMIYEDVIFSMNLWGKRPSYTLIPYTGYNYRLNAASTTSRTDRQARQTLFRALRDTQAPRWLKCYTKLRLRLHFWMEDLRKRPK